MDEKKDIEKIIKAYKDGEIDFATCFNIIRDDLTKLVAFFLRKYLISIDGYCTAKYYDCRDDHMQSALIKITFIINSYDPEKANFTTYSKFFFLTGFKQVCRNLCTLHKESAQNATETTTGNKRARIGNYYDLDTIEDRGPDINSGLLENELLLLLAEIYCNLDELCRKLIYYFCIINYDQDQVEKVLNISKRQFNTKRLLIHTKFNTGITKRYLHNMDDYNFTLRKFKIFFKNKYNRTRFNYYYGKITDQKKIKTMEDFYSDYLNKDLDYTNWLEINTYKIKKIIYDIYGKSIIKECTSKYRNCLNRNIIPLVKQTIIEKINNYSLQNNKSLADFLYITISSIINNFCRQECRFPIPSPSDDEIFNNIGLTLPMTMKKNFTPKTNYLEGGHISMNTINILADKVAKLDCLLKLIIDLMVNQNIVVENLCPLLQISNKSLKAYIKHIEMEVPLKDIKVLLKNPVQKDLFITSYHTVLHKSKDLYGSCSYLENPQTSYYYNMIYNLIAGKPEFQQTILVQQNINVDSYYQIFKEKLRDLFKINNFTKPAELHSSYPPPEKVHQLSYDIIENAQIFTILENNNPKKETREELHYKFIISREYGINLLYSINLKYNIIKEVIPPDFSDNFFLEYSPVSFEKNDLLKTEKKITGYLEAIYKKLQNDDIALSGDIKQYYDQFIKKFETQFLINNFTDYFKSLPVIHSADDDSNTDDLIEQIWNNHMQKDTIDTIMQKVKSSKTFGISFLYAFNARHEITKKLLNGTFSNIKKTFNLDDINDI